MRGVAIQADGHIVVVGQAKFSMKAADVAIARYNKDGSLDKTFGIGGKVTTDIDAIDDGRAVAIQRDGKIVVGGFVEHDDPTLFNGVLDEFVVIRYDTNGSLDTTFGVAGVETTDFGPDGPAQANSVVIQADGKIVLAGTVLGTETLHDFALARYASNGLPDRTFGANDLVITDLGGTSDFETAAVLQADGKILVAGSANDRFAVARYNTNGCRT